MDAQQIFMNEIEKMAAIAGKIPLGRQVSKADPEMRSFLAEKLKYARTLPMINKGGYLLSGRGAARTELAEHRGERWPLGETTPESRANYHKQHSEEYGRNWSGAEKTRKMGKGLESTSSGSTKANA